MRQKTELWILGLCLITSCAILESEDPPAQYAPSNATKSRSGKVAYNPNGLSEMVKARRDDAYKQIYQFCGSSKYKITKDATVPARNSTASGISTLGADEIREITFECY